MAAAAARGVDGRVTDAEGGAVPASRATRKQHSVRVFLHLYVPASKLARNCNGSGLGMRQCSLSQPQRIVYLERSTISTRDANKNDKGSGAWTLLTRQSGA